MKWWNERKKPFYNLHRSSVLFSVNVFDEPMYTVSGCVRVWEWVEIVQVFIWPKNCVFSLLSRPPTFSFNICVPVSWKQWRNWNDYLIFRPHSLQPQRGRKIGRQRVSEIPCSTVAAHYCDSPIISPQYTRKHSSTHPHDRGRVTESQWYSGKFQRKDPIEESQRDDHNLFLFEKKTHFFWKNAPSKIILIIFGVPRMNERMEKKKMKIKAKKKGKEKLLTNKVWRTEFFFSSRFAFYLPFPNNKKTREKDP